MKTIKKHMNKLELLAPAGLSAKAHNYKYKSKEVRGFIKKSKNRLELLAPAGSFEKMKYALEYGADAVYAGIPETSMRARINSFTPESLLKATEYAHARGKKMFVTLNIYAHNYHLPTIEKHLKFLQGISVDGVIVADPGIINLVKKYLPKVDIHLSTQANVTNWQAAKFWYDLGVKRIVLAREVTLADIQEIHKKVPKVELEYFVHGAMCMSYSGRCILSKWLTGKSANLGDCTQPCRWAYRPNFQFPPQRDKLEAKISNFQTISNDSIFKRNTDAGKYKTAAVQEIQSGRIIELEEDSHGTYFFNSKDLNLIAHLKDLKDAGVVSFKIEGRNKSVFYVASVVRAYRTVLDAIEAKKSAGEIRKIQKWAEKELNKTVNRGYTKGFLLGNNPEHNLAGQMNGANSNSVGEIIEVTGKILQVKVHNALYVKDSVEIMAKDKNIPVKILNIKNEQGEEVPSAHGGHGGLYFIEINKKDIEPMSLIRKTS